MTTMQDLIDKVRAAQSKRGQKPVSYAVLAEQVKMTRPHFHRLRSGRSLAPSWTCERIASTWGLKTADVQAATALSVKRARKRPRKKAAKRPTRKAS